MLRHILALTVLFSLTSSLRVHAVIDFHREHQKRKAERLFAEEKYAEARETFQDLADSAADEVQQGAFRARAAVALGHMEGKHEAALAEAAQLAPSPVAQYARITLMAARLDWDGIVQTFGDTLIVDWPSVKLPPRPRGAEEEMKTHALLKRARAFEQTGAYERAEQDLATAADLLASRHPRAQPGLLSVLTDLATLRARRLDDAAGAFEANRRIAALGSGGARYYRGVLSAAAYLRGQENYAAAVEMIESMRPRTTRGSWYPNSMFPLGRTLALAGRVEEALDVFREVTERRNADKRTVGAAYLAWADTLAEAERTDEAIVVYRRFLEQPDMRDEQREQAEEAIRNLETAGEMDT